MLATLPDWFFLAHQAMTDMPYVGLMTGGLALFVPEGRSRTAQSA